MSIECKIVMVQPQPTAVVAVTVPMTELMQAQKTARAKIAAALPTLNAGVDRYGCTLWRPAGEGKLYMEPGVIVSRSFKRSGEVVPSELPGGRAAHYVMRGPYDGLPAAWNILLGWVKERNLRSAGSNWEVYGDEHPDPAKLKASLYVLLK
jgi:effector-binding domain-containing protein